MATTAFGPQQLVAIEMLMNDTSFLNLFIGHTISIGLEVLYFNFVFSFKNGFSYK